jgi:hypothetical protein
MKSKIYLRNKIVYNFFNDVCIIINKQILNITYSTNENKKIHIN